ncbi:MAG TPA: hypothetical protein VFO72_10915, partial [Pyrinomonadaceae bacterium]|nr:hypothetical protein [Pyrinomonadaceae bacterium]
MSEFFESFASLFRKPARDTDEKPFHAEFYSVERLEQYAQALAAEHKTVTRKGRAILLPRLAENGRILESAYKALVEALREGRAISPAAEWLVDNYHIVEEQLREIRHDLPKSYYHELPKLTDGELAGYPRIYAVALELITHTDSRLDTNSLRRFIAAYQTVSPLSIGELWAVAITLRLALVENLRRLAVNIARARAEREEADLLADKLLELASLQPTAINTTVTERLGKREELPQTFLVQLIQRLREQHPSVMPVMDWIEKQLGRQGASVEQIIHTEHQRQAAAQVTVGNIITSMRLLSTLDWNDFFEKVSLIEPLLGKDPAGAYLRMEFASRDRYRHVIERISKRTRTSELKIAQATVKLATEAKENDAQAKKHVGYYLIDEGLPQLEAIFRYRPRTREKLRRFLVRHATASYLGVIALLTILLLGFLLTAMSLAGASWLVLVAAGLLALIPASDLAVTVVNWDLTHFFPPRLLPRIETLTGIPENTSTFVVVPTIFFSESQVQELIERLE